MRCKAAEGHQADPGDAEEECSTERALGQEREQSHGKDALGDVEDRAYGVADPGIVAHGDRKARRAGGRHKERQHHEGNNHENEPNDGGPPNTLVGASANRYA